MIRRLLGRPLALFIALCPLAGSATPSASVALPDPAVLPAEGSAPWGNDPLDRARLSGGKNGGFSLTKVADHGTRLATVLEFRAEQAFDGEPWQLQLTIPSTAAVAKGDTLFFELYLRTIGTKAENGEGRTILIMENCTRVVIENHLKWPMWETGLRPDAPPKLRNSTTLESLAWLNRQNGIDYFKLDSVKVPEPLLSLAAAGLKLPDTF